MIRLNSTQARRLGLKSPKPRTKGGGKSKLVETLLGQIKAAGLPEPETEYEFCKQDVVAYARFGPRKWRIDLFWLKAQDPFCPPVACEVEGGLYVRGRHLRPQGFENDARKYNAICSLGYQLIRVTGPMIKSGEALRLIEDALK